ERMTSRFSLKYVKVKEPTGEPNITTIFNNYTNAKESESGYSPTLFKKDIVTGSIKFGSIEYIQMQITGLHKETRLEKDKFSITLTKFPDSMTTQDLSNIMKQVGAKAYHTSQTNKIFRRFASLNSTFQEDLTKAIANNIDFKGHKLIWVARTAKLCYYCGNTQHMIANCNETYYNNKNQYRYNGSNKSYANVTQGINMHHLSNGKLLVLVHHIQKTITKVQHQISQLEKRVSILEKDAAYRHMDEMEEDMKSTSDSTIFATKQLIETEDIKTTQS
ncbi:10455_t:CDS:2, partial [Acaulospora morrowiae]